MAKASDRFPRVDSMRAIAALLVIAFHLNGYIVWPSHLLQPLALHADLGVPILFVISSFVLYRPFAAAHVRGTPAPELFAYTVRRIARIVPAYWIITTIVGLVEHQQYLWSVHGFVHIYCFLQIYSPDLALSGLGVSWTLCVEVVLYAALPLFAWAAVRLGRRLQVTPLRAHGIVIGVLFVVGIAYQLVAVHLSDPNLYASATAPVYLPFPAYLDEFALGMGLAVWSVAVSAGRPWAVRPYEWLARRPSLPVLVALVVFAVLAFALGYKGLPGSGMSGAVWLLRHVSYGLLAALLLVPAVIQGPARGIVQRVLGSRALRGISIIAYGVYLFHASVLLEIHTGLRKLGFTWLEHSYGLASKAVFTLLVLAVTIVLATLSYVLVERPAQRLARRVGRRPGASAPVTPQPLRAGATGEVDLS